jgi:hypothetical protein
MTKRAKYFALPGCIALLLAANSCSTLTARKPIELFNGKDLTGWNYLSADPQIPMEQVWSVKDGVLNCQGNPVGAIYQCENLTNFLLVVEYRWPVGIKPANSGIFSRIHGEMKPIPQAVEVQLQHGNAGDVMGLQGRKVATGQARFFEVKAHPLAGDVAGVRKLSDQEKTPGEWNRVEVAANGGRYSVWMNGKLINQVDGVEVVGGAIGLQSEGGPIQFRRATLFRVD